MVIKYGLLTFAICLIVIWTIMMYTIIKSFRVLFDQKYTKALLGVVVVITCLGLLKYANYACFEAGVRLEQNVDMTPIAELKLPENIDSVEQLFKDKSISYRVVKPEGDLFNGFENSYKIKKKIIFEYIKEPSIYVTVTIYENEEKAKEAYLDRSRDYNSMKMYSAKLNNSQYTVTLMTRSRGSIEWGAILYDEISSSALIQNSNLIVNISERTTDASDTKMQEAINFVAETLGTLNEPDNKGVL
ncbi:MAG TPA: hypothetical protein DD791_04790 [Syntrophomonas sp.]|nr:hypothetical protein [Syntrophomonas sp.]